MPHLSKNSLSGPIPAQIQHLENLNLLSLHDNDFSGSIPPEVGKLKRLTTLDLSMNALDGSLPMELASISSLTNLYIQSNKIIGSIPIELADMKGLQELDLSGNLLSGSIPNPLFNLSKLKLDGNCFDTSSFSNPGLIENTTQRPQTQCGQQINSPPLTNPPPTAPSLAVPIGASLTALLILAVTLTFIILWLRKRRPDASPPKPSGAPPMVWPRRFETVDSEKTSTLFDSALPRAFHNGEDEGEEKEAVRGTLFGDLRGSLLRKGTGKDEEEYQTNEGGSSSRGIAERQVATWGGGEVVEWLKRVGVAGEVVDVLRANGVDGPKLLTLTDDNLREMGMEMPTRRGIILQLIADLSRDHFSDGGGPAVADDAPPVYDV
ncbi:hypothetical protein HDU67_002337 [Dinochytrium kinnereticum]|nr:hypothetical protein HDU67_002337 [Dinochytrium kinnereticum]